MAKITFIARMTCKPGRQRALVELCHTLERHVHANEPDTLAYEFFKLREENRFAVLESFLDEAAEKHHASSAVLAELAPRIADCLDGSWVREFFDVIG